MNNQLLVRIFSFGYLMSGIPTDESGHNGGFVFDCRFLPNPGREKQYMALTGKDNEVIEYLSDHKIVSHFLNHAFKIIDMAIENYQSRDFTSLMISFGCTGGQHRSVYCAEQCAAYLKSQNIRCEITHTEYPQLNDIK